MALRTFALALVAVLALFWGVMLVATWSERDALYGWNLGADGSTLIGVVPAGPADRAGLRAGDRIDWSALPLVARANLAIVEAVSPSSKIAVTFTRAGVTRTVTVVPAPWPSVFEHASRVLTLAGLFLTAIGIALVQLRPSRMTWGFLLSSLLWAYPSSLRWLWAQSAPWKFAIAEPAVSILLGAYAAGILIFMSRFPSDHPRGVLRILDRAAVPFGAAVAALALYVDADILLSPRPPAAWALFLTQSFIQIVIFAIALAALMTSYALTKSSDRQRIVPVLIAFAFYVACNMAHTVYSAFHTNPLVSAMQYLLIALSMVALAVAVANGVVRHRVFDVSFAISRTLVYSILTTIVVGAFVLVDFVSSKLLERFQITVAIEALAALALGMWFNVLHARIDRFVDRVLFRKRHLAEGRLERIGRALVYAESPAFIDEALVVEACDALALISAAVFRRDGTQTFVRALSRGWDGAHVQALSSEDHLVVNLMSELDALDLTGIRWPRSDVPRDIMQPLIAVPLSVRHELLGFVLYGGHVGGEAIDPDERRTLVRLAASAAASSEHVRAAALVSEANELRAENALLQQERSLLREMVDALRNATRL